MKRTPKIDTDKPEKMTRTSARKMQQQINLRKNANYINNNKIIVIADYDNATIQQQIKTARKLGNVIDLTDNQKPNYVIFMESGQLVLTNSMT